MLHILDILLHKFQLEQFLQFKFIYQPQPTVLNPRFRKGGENKITNNSKG